MMKSGYCELAIAFLGVDGDWNSAIMLQKRLSQQPRRVSDSNCVETKALRDEFVEGEKEKKEHSVTDAPSYKRRLVKTVKKHMVLSKEGKAVTVDDAQNEHSETGLDSSFLPMNMKLEVDGNLFDSEENQLFILMLRKGLYHFPTQKQTYLFLVLFTI